MTNNFVHLHLHTEYSLLDGVGKIDEYLYRAKELGMKAMAITDHGNMFGAVEFYQKALKVGIKPIIGFEAYLAEFSMEEKKGKNFHLILLAKNEKGYKNLLKLTSLSYEKGFYHKPRIDKKILSEFNDGIIALSACMQGEIPFYIRENNYEKAKEALLEYLEIFGEDFYIELQDNGVAEQYPLNDQLYDFAIKENIKVVATNDVHYTYHGDHELQDVMLCVQTAKKLSDENRMKIETTELFFKSHEQINSKLSKYGDAVKNTEKIADQCNLKIEFGKFKFPEYKLPDDKESIENYLEELTKKGLIKRYGNQVTEEIKERVKFELGIINKMGYAAYFVVVWDFIYYAKKNGIPVGPGRGSAAGSIIAYLLGITDLDPLKYNLIFERFLNPERISMPDIDIDICQERRHEVIAYVSEKYGKDHVAQIITFGTMKARAAIRDVGRVMDVPLSKIDKIAKMIPSHGSNIDSALVDIAELQKLYNEDTEVQKLLDYSRRIEGKVRHASVHAAGIVITKLPIVEEVPIYYDNRNSIFSTQYQMKELEELGLLKMDFLGLRNLTIIQRTIDYIKKHTNKILDINQIDLEDKKVYELFQAGDTLGVFQLESSGMIKLMKKMKPDRFEDIIALLALYRPGPLGSGMVDDYINVKNGFARPKYPDESLKDVLEETYGVILYQEQVMKIASIMANYTMGEADLLRRAMGKKKIEIMEENREKFVKRALENGYTEDKSREIFNLIDKFAGYGFNKSHSAAYALIVYWTAYLKTHYTIYYFAALMTSEMNNMDKLSLYIEDAKKRKIKVLPPDVNFPSVKFNVKKDSLTFGMAAIKNMGESIVQGIIEERKLNGKYINYENFVNRTKSLGVNKKSLEALVFSGSLDSLPGNRKQKYSSISQVLDNATKFLKKDEIQQMNLFGEAQVSINKFELPNVTEFELEQLLRGEKEFVGLYLSGHPLDRYKDIFKVYDFNSILQIKKENINYPKTFGIIKNLKKLVTKRTKEAMAVFELEGYDGKISVTVFPREFKQYSHYLLENEVVYVEGSVTIDSFSGHEEKKILSKIVKTLEEIEEINKFRVYILVEEKNKKNMVDLKKILKNHYGNHKVYLAMKEEKDKRLIELSEKYTVVPSKFFIEEIVSLLGEGTIKIK